MREFIEIVRSGKWQLNGGSKCGPGTDNAAGAFTAVQFLIEHFIPTNGLILDIACGDGAFMAPALNAAGKRIAYHGIDIVEDNLRLFAARLPKQRAVIRPVLQQGDASEIELPRADLVILRDVLIHLPFADAERLLNNIRESGSRTILTTTFVEADRNFNLSRIDGDYYPINVTKPPFNLQPSMLFFDGYGGLQKYLAVCSIVK